MKTASQVLRETFERHNNDPDSKLSIVEIECEAMRNFAKEALQEFRDELLRELPPVTAKDTHKYRYKVGQYILDTDLTQFIT